MFAARGARLYGGRDSATPEDVAHKQRHDAGQGIAHGKYHLEPGARVAGHAVNPDATAQVQWEKRTDVLTFKPGYENRRINITMLFGRRIAPESGT